MRKVTKLNQLHEKLSEVLLDAITNGEVREVEGVAVRLTPTAAILNVARQFLKDNNIDGEPVDGTALGALANQAKAALPFKEPADDVQALMVPDRDMDDAEF